MNHFSVIVALSALLLGCARSDNLVGTGQITLSDFAYQIYTQRYLKSHHPGFFLVSENGMIGEMSVCPTGPGQCDQDTKFREAKWRCERLSGKKCLVFAQGNKIVWSGAVIIARDGERLDEVPVRMSGYHLCSSAITRPLETSSWSPDPAYRRFVAKAFESKFSINECVQLVTYGNPSRQKNQASLGTMPRELLCKAATELYRWRNDHESAGYVSEARRRKLTPTSCH